MFKMRYWQRCCWALLMVCGLVGGLTGCDHGGGGHGETPAAQAPKVTTEPGSVTVPAGAAATFSVVASGSAPMTYQWLRDGTAIGGATGSSYTTAATVSGDNGALFSVRISNSVNQVTSVAAMLTVTPQTAAPTITSGPADATATEGQVASFSVEAISPGSTARYQWRRNGQDIDGAITAAYSTGATTAADHGSTYAVVVTNANGSIVSGAARLTVNSPPRVTTAPQDANHFVGETARFEVGVSGTAPFTYNWLRDGVGLPGATGSSYTTAALGLADAGGRYSVQVTNPFGTTLSAVAVLNVAPVPTAPVISTQPQDTTVLPGNSASFSVTASGTGPLSYQWFKNGSAITGATLASYTTPTLAWADTLGGYSVSVSNAVGRVNSRSATLTVPPRVTQVATGHSFIAVRKEDGTVWSLGRRDVLGAGAVSVPEGTAVRAINTNGTALSDVQAVMGGNNHALALKTDGSLWAWGYGDNGQLGNNPGSQANVLYPVTVLTSATATLNGLQQIAAHDDHAIALKTDGTAWVWGSGVSGRLGNGIRNSASSVAVPLKDSLGNTLSGIRQVAVGGSFGMVLMNDGTAFGFGENQFGELGDGSNQERLWATLVKDGNANAFGNITAVQAGRTATAFLRTDGTVWMTGRNLSGVLARPLATTSLNQPTQVLMADGTPLDRVRQLAFSQETVVVLRQDGTVWGWGLNFNGQLGTTAALTAGCTCSAVPVQIAVGR